MKTKKMNYVLIPLSLVVLLTVGLVSAHAIGSSWGPDDDMVTMGAMNGARGEGHAFGGHGGTQHLKMLAIALDFTDEQKAQVKEIVSAKREKMQALRQQKRDAQQQRRSLMESDRFDEVVFRAQAEKVAALRIELMVNRAKTRQAIFAVMTAEQQEKAQKMKQVMSSKQRGKKGSKGSRR
jgi:Spy/CpxP family protein refolding chaperone